MSLEFFTKTPCQFSVHKLLSRFFSRQFLVFLALSYLVLNVQITDKLKTLKSILEPNVWILKE